MLKFTINYPRNVPILLLILMAMRSSVRSLYHSSLAQLPGCLPNVVRLNVSKCSENQKIWKLSSSCQKSLPTRDYLLNLYAFGLSIPLTTKVYLLGLSVKWYSMGILPSSLFKMVILIASSAALLLDFTFGMRLLGKNISYPLCNG